MLLTMPRQSVVPFMVRDSNLPRKASETLASVAAAVVIAAAAIERGRAQASRK
jgi:hypothetical protein